MGQKAGTCLLHVHAMIAASREGERRQKARYGETDAQPNELCAAQVAHPHNAPREQPSLLRLGSGKTAAVPQVTQTYSVEPSGLCFSSLTALLSHWGHLTSMLAFSRR
jgi:hypothetical protein